MNDIHGAETYRICVAEKYIKVQCVYLGCQNATSFNYTQSSGQLPKNIKIFEVIKHVHKRDKHEAGLLKAKYCEPSTPKILLPDYLKAITSEMV
jgi:hypothetical protein